MIDQTSHQSPSQVEYRSSFADDPDMAEIVEMFVEDAPEKVERFQEAVEGKDHEKMRVLAHQLKGAAAGYGFEDLSELSRQLEMSANECNEQEIASRCQVVMDYLAAIRA